MWFYKSGQEVFLIWQLFHILGWSSGGAENEWVEKGGIGKMGIMPKICRDE